MPAAPIETRRIVDHRVHALVPFDMPAETALGDLVRRADAQPAGRARPIAEWVPARVRPALAERYAKEPVWQADPDHSIDGAFHTHVRALMSGAGPQVVRSVLNEHARRLLDDAVLTREGEGGPQTPRHELRLKVPAGGARRLSIAAGETPQPQGGGMYFRLIVHNVRAYRFRTGLVLADAELEIAQIDGSPLTAAMLIEAADALSHVHTLAWYVRSGDGAGTTLPQDFDLTDVLASLVEGAGGFRASVHRTFLATFASLAATGEPPADRVALAALAYKLARQYTSDYAVPAELDVDTTVAEFETIASVAAREGTATVVDLAPRPGETAAPEPIRNYRTGSFNTSILPLTWLAVHERAAVVAITSRSAIWPQAGDHYDQTIATLEEVSRRALELRLAYRFSEVSRIGQHNTWNDVLRRALALDAMAAEMQGDVREINQFLRRRHADEERQRALRVETRYRWFVAVTAGAVAGNATFSFLKEVATLLELKQAGWMVLGSAVLVGVLVGWVTWSKGRADPPSAGASQSAGTKTPAP